MASSTFSFLKKPASRPPTAAPQSLLAMSDENGSTRNTVLGAANANTSFEGNASESGVFLRPPFHREVTFAPKLKRAKSQSAVDKLLSFNAGSPREGTSKEDDMAGFRKQVEVMRKALKHRRCETLDPRSRFVRCWDFVLICAMLHTAFITPFEAAFTAEVEVGVLGTASSGAIARFAVNRVVDVIFVLDIIISFFMPFRTSSIQGGAWVHNRKRVVSNYLRTWFVPDLLTCVPFDVIVSVTARGTETSFGQELRVVRMVRVLKLVRIVRATRILRRWQDQVAISFAFATLIRFVLITLVLAHWLACAWGMLGVPQVEASSIDLSGIAHAPDGGPNWSGKYSDGLTWIQKYQLEKLSPWELYGVSLYVALNNIFGGACEVNPANPAEFFAQCAMLLLGSSVWAYIIGSACGIIATLDPASIEYRQTMDELNFFCADQSIPEELRIELRAYFRNTLYNVRLKRYETLLAKMSQKLRGDAAFRMCEYRLSRVPYLVHPDVEEEFMSNMAIKLVPSVYSHLERVPCSSLFIVVRGVVAKRGRLCVSGASLGHDVILSNDNLRDMGDAIALTFVQGSCLRQVDIFHLLPEYPMAYRVVRKAAMRMALTRALTKASRIARRERAAQQQPNGAGGAAGAIADMVYDIRPGASLSMEDALSRALKEPLYPIVASSMQPDPSNQAASIATVESQNLTKGQGQSGQQHTDQEVISKNDGKGRSKSRRGQAKELWGQYTRVVKPPTTDERIDELRDEMREINTEVLKRIGKMERLLRDSNPRHAKETSPEPQHEQRRGAFASFFTSNAEEQEARRRAGAPPSALWA